MKERTHSLPSFSAWLNKGFDLRAQAARMADARTDPEISPSSIFLAMFHSFVFRLPSFQQLDSELAHSHLQDWIGAERGFRDDTLRYSLCGFDLDPLEAMLVDVNRRLKRGKAFDEGRVQGRLVAALDGIEVLSSFSRRCDSCLERRVILKDQAGRKIDRLSITIALSVVRWSTAQSNRSSLSSGFSRARARTRLRFVCSIACPICMEAGFSTSCFWMRFTRRLRCWNWLERSDGMRSSA